jgi:hypothetical protein
MRSPIWAAQRSGRLMQPKLAEAAGPGLLKIVEKPCRDVAASCVRSVKAPLEKKASDSSGRMAAAWASNCLAEVLRADRENLSFHAAAWPRRPMDLPIAMTAFASGDDVVDSAQTPKELTQFLTRLFRMSVAEMS